MKALAIGFDSDEFLTNKKLIESNFNKNDICIYNSETDLVEILTSEGPFSFIILNLDDKHFSAPEIYESIVDIIGLRPFVFIGSPNSIKSQLTHELINNQKTNHILENPIVPKEFNKAVAHSLSWIKNEEFEQSIQEFTRDDMRPLRIKTFFLFESLPYDVYLELTPNKFGKIISRNKFFSHQLISSYSRKNIKFLYIKKNEHLKTLDAAIKNLIAIYKAKHIERSKIVKIHQRTFFFIQEYIRCLTVTDEINELSHLVSDSISTIVSQGYTFKQLLNEIEHLEHVTFSEASLITAYLCLYIIQEMHWNADMTKERLVLASIIQDIHLQNDELIKIRSLNDPYLADFTEEEVEQFKNHPSKAKEVANLFHGFLELDFILKEHHEHPTGDGFPVGINSSNLTTISCIFILATFITSKIARSSETGTINLKEIYTSVKKIYSIGNFKDPVKALQKILV